MIPEAFNPLRQELKVRHLFPDLNPQVIEEMETAVSVLQQGLQAERFPIIEDGQKSLGITLEEGPTDKDRMSSVSLTPAGDDYEVTVFVVGQDPLVIHTIQAVYQGQKDASVTIRGSIQDSKDPTSSITIHRDGSYTLLPA